MFWAGTDATIEEACLESQAVESYLASTIPPHVAVVDTPRTKNPNDRRGDPTTQEYVTPLYLGNPRNLQTTFELRDDLSGYDIYERIGKIDIRPPSHISFEDYQEYRRKKMMEDYYRQQAMQSNEELRKGLIPTFELDQISDIFGGGTVEIRPTGFATLDFSVDHNRTDNPSLPLRQQRVTTFNFDQQIQLGIIGQIGEKMRINAAFDTQATFDFDNELKLEHTGTEDQILQKIEAGNVNLSLGNSLIQGRQNLFGLKTELRFGPINVTAVGSTERGKVESISVAGGGAIETPFEKEASEYDMNRHFFLSHYFRAQYERALANLPIITSSVRINRIQVWVVQGGSTQNNRNAVGLLDLGEGAFSAPSGRDTTALFNRNSITIDGRVRFPDNNANDLYQRLIADPAFRSQTSTVNALTGLGLQNTLDFEVAGNMRLLQENEYTLNPQLGYISLNTPVNNNQVLFVAYNYTVNGQAYQVGEFSDDVPADGLNSNVLFTKMLKPSVTRPLHQGKKYPAWDLMMKNIYNIGYGLERDGFFLDIKYESGTSAGKVNFLPEGRIANKLLIQVMQLDRLTNHTSPGPDNFFDFIEGLTIIPDRGQVIFPVLEPFGSHLARQLNNPNDSANYVFQALYDDTQQGAIQNFPHLNRFTLEGYYRSSSNSEIPLNTFNLAEGSVIVSAGGVPLIEGQDYIVDYFGGKVTIINQAVLTSGQQIDVSYESSSLYNIQTKTLLGARAEYAAAEDFQIGATILNLREQPFNQKQTLGDEPINNTLWGLDASLRKDSDFLTKMIDRLPLISTKQTSSIQASGEFAQFIPGQPKIVKNSNERGIAYIDDFEAAKTPFSLQGQLHWKLASFPSGGSVPDPTIPGDSLSPGYTRAKLAWYQIDQAFYQGRGFNINFPEEDLANNYTRRISPFELFPTASRAFGNTIQYTFDLHYLPAERGPYNYQTSPDKIDPQGKFTNPKENWAGIMREIDVNNDFEATNVEFLEFWLMDPYMDATNHQGGQFYIDLGLINEDVLPDQGLSRENGLPRNADDTLNINRTAWGRVPFGNPPVNAFSNDPEERKFQDVGLDGLNDENERTFFQRYLDQMATVLQGGTSSPAYQQLLKDPSADNFLHFRDDSLEAQGLGILERYLNYNGTDGNSPVSDNNNRNFTIQGSQTPDTEDINENGSLNFAEQYWEYRIDLSPNALRPGQNFIIDEITSQVPVDGSGSQTVEVTWYQFRIPLKSGRPVNGIGDFKSISYMRMYLTGFEEEVVLRTTEFQLVSTQWRRYTENLEEDAPSVNPPEPPFAEFEVGSVSLEENSEKQPFNYVLPPGVRQQAINGNTQAGFLQNERSLALNVCGLEDGDARAVFKTQTLNRDFRQYERVRMWVHAEADNNGITPANFDEVGDAYIFLRLGLDNDFNYYEYQMPLTPSNPGLSANDPANVWPEEMNIELAVLAFAKSARNNSLTGPGNRFEYFDPERMPEGHRVIVKGTPKLSDVRNIMIGVRNPKDPSGRPICLEVWVNELRMTDFNTKTGWAANANLDLKLADLGSVRASMSYRSAGFGPLEQRITERSQEDVLRYDIAANLSLDRLFPKKWGLQLPVYATFGEQFVNPEFNPQEADVSIDKLVEGRGREEANQLLRKVQDYTRTRSISFNNWKKTKTRESGKSYPWDISNFDFTYAYNEQYARNAIIEKRFTTQHRAAINYRYNFPQVLWEPFKNMKLKTPLSQFNFSPLPTSLTMSVAGDRRFEERIMRPTSQFGGAVDPTYSKDFLLTRNYNLVWNFTRNLQFSFNATNTSRVDEVKGYWRDATQRERDSVGTLWENLLHFGRDRIIAGDFERQHENLINMGRTTNYQHNFNAAYQLPFSAYKLTDWINGTVNYSGSFRWQQAPEIVRGIQNTDTTRAIGGTIANTQTLQANARLDLGRLYRKVGFLKKVLDKQNNRQQPGRQLPGPRVPQQPQAEQDTAKKESKFLKARKWVGGELVRIAFSVQSFDVSYNINAGTILPNYLPKTDNFGLDFRYEDPFGNSTRSHLPPTLGFVLGSQRDIRQIAAQNNWISRDTTLANLFMQNWSEQITARTSVELFKGFRIELSANRSFTQNDSEFFRWNEQEQTYSSFDPLRNGNFSMSYIFIGTTFEKNEDISPSFERFSFNRHTISRRLAQENPNDFVLSQTGLVDGEYENGYLGDNPDVLIPSLIAAYGIIDADKVQLSNFPKIPLPNWSIDYNGLSNIPALKKVLNTITIRHTYRASYTVGSFNLNLFASELAGYPGAVDSVGVTGSGVRIENYEPINNIQAVQITEQFSPFLGFNMNWKNGLTSSIDYKRGRTLTFSTGNLQLTELRNQDLAVSVGFRKDRLNWNFTLFGKDIELNNSMNAQLRITMRDTRERNRSLSFSANNPEPVLNYGYTRGTLNWIISPSIDYVVNTRINVKLFFEQNINRPFVSSSYNTSFSSGGVQIRFTLAN
ncbi:MAG: cell surface protein SprA [Bacteroidetes bacterium]|nr:MAG: cell surface protein SprA [Bacteroidota bacterium]